MIPSPTETLPFEVRNFIEACPFTTWDVEGSEGTFGPDAQPEGIFSIVSGNLCQLAILALPTEANLKAAIRCPRGVLNFHAVLGDECVKVHFELTEVVGMATDSRDVERWGTPLAKADCLLLLGRFERVEVRNESGEMSSMYPMMAGVEGGFLRPPSKKTIAMN